MGLLLQTPFSTLNELGSLSWLPNKNSVKAADVPQLEESLPSMYGVLSSTPGTSQTRNGSIFLGHQPWESERRKKISPRPSLTTWAGQASLGYMGEVEASLDYMRIFFKWSYIASFDKESVRFLVSSGKTGLPFGVGTNKTNGDNFGEINHGETTHVGFEASA